jgi:alcohol dehydrogenase class IV
MSAVFNTPHGLANAVLMPYILDYQLKYPCAVEKLAQIATYMELPVTSSEPMVKAQAVIKHIYDLLKITQIPTNLNDVQANITEEQINNMAKKAMKDFCGISNCVQFSRRQVKIIYRNAIQGYFMHTSLKG